MFMILNCENLGAVHTHTHTLCLQANINNIINYILRYINMLRGLGNRYKKLLLSLFAF